MTQWLHETPVAVCPTCGTDCSPWRPVDIVLDWRDDAEREAGHLAVGLMAHRYHLHRVDVVVGDLVRYWAPWRGLILGSDVYRVASFSEHDQHEFARQMGNISSAPLLGTSYTLVNPAKANDRCFPFVGDPCRPIVFEVVESAPPAEVDLLDLLDWADAS